MMQGTPRQMSEGAPDLLGALRLRAAQARETSAPYLAAVAERDTMLFWLSRGCKEARVAAGRIQSHVAAGASVDQSTINRFETAPAWSKNTDKIVAAYADDLDVSPVELWAQAVQLWREDERNRVADLAVADLTPAEDQPAPPAAADAKPARAVRGRRRSAG